LAFAHSIHVQHVPVISPVGCYENCYAKFSYPQLGKKDVAILNGQVKQIEEEFLCPFPCAMVDRIGICHSISLIYIAHAADKKIFSPAKTQRSEMPYYG